MRKPSYDFVGGELLLVDKPETWTSFDAVNKLRHTIRNVTGLKKMKVGHAGTLDPLATGLLVICTGKFTKKLQDLQGLDKVYTGTMRLGAITPSLDRETEVSQTWPVEGITPEQLAETAVKLTGPIDQRPPGYSAMRVDGERSYQKVRRGEAVELPPRQVMIHEFGIDPDGMPDIEFNVHCGKGTYIRSLARDFGALLDNGAYLTELRRTKIGDFDIENAVPIEELCDHIRAVYPV